MKFKIYYTENDLILSDIIRSQNLKKEDGGRSGSLDNLECGIIPKKGFVAKFGGKIIGWGAQFIEKRNRYSQPEISFQLYVSPKYRRKGVGTRIIKRAISKFGTINVYSWNNRSKKFFNNFKKIKDEGYYT